MKNILAQGYGKKFIRDSDEDYYYSFIKNGVAVLARKYDELVLVEQFRLPVEENTLELICGAIENGETPEEAAIREVREEIGFDIDSLDFLGSFYPSPGNTTEEVFLFYARLGDYIGRDVQEDEGELRTLFIREDEFIKMLNNGEFKHPFIPLAYFLSKKNYD